MRYFKHLVFGGVFLAFQIASAQKTIHNFSCVVVPIQFYFLKTSGSVTVEFPGQIFI